MPLNQELVSRAERFKINRGKVMLQCVYTRQVEVDFPNPPSFLSLPLLTLALVEAATSPLCSSSPDIKASCSLQGHFTEEKERAQQPLSLTSRD